MHFKGLVCTFFLSLFLSLAPVDLSLFFLATNFVLKTNDKQQILLTREKKCVLEKYETEQNKYSFRHSILITTINKNDYWRTENSCSFANSCTLNILVVKNSLFFESFRSFQSENRFHLFDKNNRSASTTLSRLTLM